MQEVLTPLFDQLLLSYNELLLVSIHLKINPVICLGNKHRNNNIAKGSSASHPSSPESLINKVNSINDNNTGTDISFVEQQQIQQENSGGDNEQNDKDIKRVNKQNNNHVININNIHPNIIWQLAEFGINSDLFAKLGLGKLKNITTCNESNNSMLVSMGPLILVFIGTTKFDIIAFKKEVIPLFQTILEPVVNYLSNLKNKN